MKGVILLLVTLPFFAACDDPGAGEQIGEEIDEAVEDIRAGEETTGNRIDDAVDEVREGTEDVREDVEDAVEDAREDLENE